MVAIVALVVDIVDFEQNLGCPEEVPAAAAADSHAAAGTGLVVVDPYS